MVISVGRPTARSRQLSLLMLLSVGVFVVFVFNRMQVPRSNGESPGLRTNKSGSGSDRLRLGFGQILGQHAFAVSLVKVTSDSSRSSHSRG